VQPLLTQASVWWSTSLACIRMSMFVFKLNYVNQRTNDLLFLQYAVLRHLHRVIVCICKVQLTLYIDRVLFIAVLFWQMCTF